MEEMTQNRMKTESPFQTEYNELVQAFSTEPISVTETAEEIEPSWTHPHLISGADIQQHSKLKIEKSLAELFLLIESRKDFSESRCRLADFLISQIKHQSIGNLIQEILLTRYSRVWMERFLIILLDVKTSDWQTLDYALQFRHLKRLFLRVEKKMSLNAAESNLAGELIQNLSLSNCCDFESYVEHAFKTIESMRLGNIAVSGDLGLLVYLLRSETIAMGERKHWLEDVLISGDPESVIKKTPHLNLLEERIVRTQALADRLGTYGSLQESRMGLAESMGADYFSQLINALALVPELKPLLETIKLQEQKRIPNRDLIALSTLCRWNLEAQGLKTAPLHWIRAALESYNRGHFCLAVTGGLPAVDILLSEVTIEKTGALVFGNFGENPYNSWIARDGLSRPFRSSNPDRNPPDLRSLVLANINRDTIILKLLEQRSVYLSHGVVETIVTHSQSLPVLSAIAERAYLHTGSVNGHVPTALLRSQVEIPIQSISKLINPHFISFTDIKALYRMKEKLREGVADELHRFLNQAYAM